MIRNQPFYPYCERVSSYLCRGVLEPLGGASPLLREVAVAVEKYIQTGNCASIVSDQTLMWMTAQAMVAAGEESAAERLIEQVWDVGVGRFGVQCLRYREDGETESWRLFSSGVVRLSACGFEDGPLWIVDLERVHGRSGHFFELSWVPALYRLVRHVTRLWSFCGERGILAMRGARSFAESLYGTSSKARCSAVQMVEFCRQTAARVAAEHAVRSPRVITLEVQLKKGRLPVRASRRRDARTRRMVGSS